MYVEKIFPSKNIRYIAVNDNVDTFDKWNSNNDMTPFKAVINDMYTKDTSNKVRSTTNYYNPNSNATYKWNSTVINKILRNQIYVGDLVQMKMNKSLIQKNYKK